jgi:hypothetical protein
MKILDCVIGCGMILIVSGIATWDYGAAMIAAGMFLILFALPVIIWGTSK